MPVTSVSLIFDVDTVLCVPITILNDDLRDDFLEYFIVAITTSSASVILGTSRAVVEIIDDEEPVTG